MAKPNPKPPNPHKPTIGKFVSWDQAGSSILLSKGKQTITVQVSDRTVVDIDDAPSSLTMLTPGMECVCHLSSAGLAVLISAHTKD